MKVFEPEWGADGITAEDDFIERFEKAFPEFVLPPSEIVKIYQKNERYKVNQASITPELDTRLDSLMESLDNLQSI